MVQAGFEPATSAFLCIKYTISYKHRALPTELLDLSLFAPYYNIM